MEEMKYIGWVNAFLKAVENGGNREELKGKLIAVNPESTFLTQLVEKADQYYATFGTQREFEQEMLQSIRDNVLVRASATNKDEAFWADTAEKAQELANQIEEASQKRTKAFKDFYMSAIFEALNVVNTVPVVQEETKILNLREDASRA